MLTALRIINIAVWGALLVYMLLGGAMTAARGKKGHVRRADPWRLSVAAVSLAIVLGNVRWILAPDSDSLFAALYVLFALVGIYKIVLARTYGRGPKL